MRTRTIGIALAMLVLIASAYADAVFTLGNSPQQPGEQNILFQLDQTGTTIEGFTNQSHTLAQYSSTTDTLMGTGGQSDLDAVDGAINDVTFTVTGHTFSDFIFNADEPLADGDLVVHVTTNDNTFTFNYGIAHGENFLTITTTNGEVIDNVTIDSAAGFTGLKQPRVSGVSGVGVVPEPSSMMLLGSGVLGLAYSLRRKML